MEEIPKLPPSVAAVATAVPAFVGHTEKGCATPLEAVRIVSMVEYEQHFGGPPMDDVLEIKVTRTFKVTNQADGIQPTKFRSKFDFQGYSNPKVTIKPDGKACYNLYYSLQAYFANGGGPCYIVSVGDYSGDVPQPSEFFQCLQDGLEALVKEDEPTLLVFPEAACLPPNQHREVIQSALSQCAKLMDRFVLVDVNLNPAESKKVAALKPMTESANMRSGMEELRNFSPTGDASNLKYAAAYFPNIQTSLRYKVGPTTKVTVEDDYGGITDFYPPGVSSLINEDAFKGAWRVSQAGEVTSLDLAKDLNKKRQDISNLRVSIEKIPKDLKSEILKAKADVNDSIEFDESALDLGGLKAQFQSFQDKAKVLLGLQTQQTDLDDLLRQLAEAQQDEVKLSAQLASQPKADLTLNGLRSYSSELHAMVMGAIGREPVVLPPSPLMAGVYATVDRERGVWKAPANVGLALVESLGYDVSDDEHGEFNVDPKSGKSINVIRSYTGRGTLVMGARTLYGNDNEWRYVNVRRLFIMVEESCKLATQRYLFEANDARTWLKMRASITSFLTNLWREGALQGPKPEQAFYVHVGLGETMTAEDILEGKLIVEIGLAAVRPAEFIVLRFMHKMAEG